MKVRSEVEKEAIAQHTGKRESTNYVPPMKNKPNKRQTPNSPTALPLEPSILSPPFFSSQTNNQPQAPPTSRTNQFPSRFRRRPPLLDLLDRRSRVSVVSTPESSSHPKELVSASASAPLRVVVRVVVVGAMKTRLKVSVRHRVDPRRRRRRGDPPPLSLAADVSTRP